MSRIKDARFENPTIIIPESTVNKGIFFLQRTFIRELAEIKTAVVIPIEHGGHDVGNYLCDPGQGIDMIPNPMQMSHYNEKNEYLDTPICIVEPDIERIIDAKLGVTRDVFFGEAVVESQDTITSAQAVINRQVDKYNVDHDTNYPYPDYHTYALVSKTEGRIKIPNFIYAFKVPKEIWVRGQGCDDQKVGRGEKSFLGRLSPFAQKVPKEPYYTQNF